MTEQLFFMGNKRSGTSLLVKLLNLHPEIFTTHESDIVWILFQMQNGWPGKFKCHSWDGPLGMNRTLELCEEQLRSAPDLTAPGKVFETFLKVEAKLMQCPPDNTEANRRKVPKWIGDKKPVQQCDPEIRPFMRRHFPKARYLHSVRNPRAVVASKLEAAKNWPVVPEFWKRGPDEILERWAVHEQWVLQAKASEEVPILTIKFEELCENPVEGMEEIFNFLDLTLPGSIADRIRKDVHPNPNLKYETAPLPASARAAEIMEVYGYAYGGR